MGASDKVLGGGMLLVSAVVFSYYTTWTLLLPFFDPTSQIHQYFPARELAIRLPAFILVVSVGVVGIFVGSTIAKENRKQAQKAKLRAA